MNKKNSFSSRRWHWVAGCVFALFALLYPLGRTLASVDDALSFAYEAADPFVKDGFTVREDCWGGDLALGEKKAISHHLFKGNEYRFWLATDDESVKLSVHIYDSEGNLAEVEADQQGIFAFARILPKKTGTYIIIVEVEKTVEERAHWALVYGFR